MTLLKSRTFWTLVVVFLVNGAHGILPQLSGTVLDVVNAILLVLATYFHINPSQAYGSVAPQNPQA